MFSSLESAGPARQAWLGGRQAEWREALEQLVRIESPSGATAAIRQGMEAVADWARTLLDPPELELLSEDGVPQLLMRLSPSQGPRVLLLAHLDTVWEKGSFEPLFSVVGSRASGPGVFDMKGGVVIALAALASLRQDGSQPLPITLLCTGDEEVGSRASRAGIEREARLTSAVLVLEPPVGEAVKIGRKGVGSYRLHLLGRAAHAGLEPELGINAVVELAELVGQVAATASPEQGTSVTPTVLRGGQRTNVVPAEAELLVDVRFATAAEADRVDEQLHSLAPRHPQAVLELAGGPNRPPLESKASQALFQLARAVAEDLGWPELQGALVGGGSDGNFTAALGIPTLDGLGIVGGNAHAAGEWADLDSIPRRAALLAGCLQGIIGGSLG